MSQLEISVLGIGLLGPGLAGWPASHAVFAGSQPYAPAATVVPAPGRLPPAERRRAGTAIKVALAVADEACAHAQAEPAQLATVFTSSSGDGANCHALCEMLAGADRLISPTRFTNSVHNASAGYWNIAVAGRQTSTSLCAYDASFGAGLVEAVTQVQSRRQAVLLVASDTPYPEPLHATRPLPDSLGVALVLAPGEAPQAIARLAVQPDTGITNCLAESLLIGHASESIQPGHSIGKLTKGKGNVGSAGLSYGLHEKDGTESSPAYSWKNNPLIPVHVVRHQVRSQLPDFAVRPSAVSKLPCERSCVASRGAGDLAPVAGQRRKCRVYADASVPNRSGLRKCAGHEPVHDQFKYPEWLRCRDRGLR